MLYFDLTKLFACTKLLLYHLIFSVSVILCLTTYFSQFVNMFHLDNDCCENSRKLGLININPEEVHHPIS